MPQNDNAALLELLKSRNNAIQAPKQAPFVRAGEIGNIGLLSTNPFAMGHAVGDQLRRASGLRDYQDALNQANLQAGQLAQITGQQKAQTEREKLLFQNAAKFGPEVRQQMLADIGYTLPPGALSREQTGKIADIANTAASAFTTGGAGGANMLPALNQLLQGLRLSTATRQTPTSVQAAQLAPVGSVTETVPGISGNLKVTRDIGPNGQIAPRPDLSSLVQQPAGPQSAELPKQTPEQASKVSRVIATLLQRGDNVVEGGGHMRPDGSWAVETVDGRSWIIDSAGNVYKGQ